MNTCDTCKWWKEAPTSETLFHLCSNPKIGSGDDLADGLNDNADYDYGITTGPKFGCVHHQT